VVSKEKKEKEREQSIKVYYWNKTQTLGWGHVAHEKLPLKTWGVYLGGDCSAT
jgi:hypothetical protein